MSKAIHLSGAVPNAAFTYHPPSPPFIPLAASYDHFCEQAPDLPLSLDSIDPTEFSAEQVKIITGNKVQVADEAPEEGWVYERRREAQRILDYVYLGPTGSIRDHAFLKREGITLLLVAREARMFPPRLKSVDKAAEALGIEATYLEIECAQHLVKAFHEANHIINTHLLDIHNLQAKIQAKNGNAIDPATFRRGKVLITCESGNDRSAAITAAYIMATYGSPMDTAIRFLSAQRFCCCWDEEIKRKLQSWEDIIKARSQVAAFQNRSREDTPQEHHKRGYEDTMDVDEDATAGPTDQDRFMGREAFVPFRDAEI